jgi:hypothetical protein
MVPVVIVLAIIIVIFEFRYVGDLISQNFDDESIQNLTLPVNETLNVIAVNVFDEKPLLQKFAQLNNETPT